MAYNRHQNDCCEHHFFYCSPNVGKAKMDSATSNANNYQANTFNMFSKIDKRGNKIQTADIAGSIMKIIKWKHIQIK